MPEKGIVNNTENPIIPTLSRSLLLIGGLGIASVLSMFAFSGDSYQLISERDKVCRITGSGRGSNPKKPYLCAAHLYHDDGPFGGYNSPDNGLLMSTASHAFQHWLIYKWRVGDEFGIALGDSLTAASSCLNTSQAVFRQSGKDGLTFPLARTPLNEDHLLKIALYNLSWMSGLRGVRLNTSGRSVGDFSYCERRSNKREKWKAPARRRDIPKNKPPVSAITRWRPMNMDARLREVNNINGRLNGDRRVIMRDFVLDPEDGCMGSNVPDIHELVRIYSRYTYQK